MNFNKIKKMDVFLFLVSGLILLFFFKNKMDSFDLAQSFFNNKDYGQASKYISKYHGSTYEKQIKANILNGEINLALDKLESAQELFQNSVDLAKENNDVEKYQIAELYLAESLIRTGKLQDTETMLQDKIEYFKDKEPKYLFKTYYLFTLSNYYKNNDSLFNEYFEKSLNLANSFDTLNDDKYKLFILKFNIAIQQNKFDLAEKALTDVVNNFSQYHSEKNNETLYYKSLENLYTKNSKDNIDYLISLLDKDLSNGKLARINLMISSIYRKNQDFNNSLKYDLQALELFEKNTNINAIVLAPIYYQLSLDYKQLNQIDNMNKYISKINSLIEQKFLDKNNFYIVQTNKLKNIQPEQPKIDKEKKKKH